MKYPGKRIFDLIFFIILFGVCLILAWSKNFVDRQPGIPPEIYSDKADYYVYLPAAFIYHWDVNKFPKGIDSTTLGFTLNYKSQKLIVKTTCGVAILVTPFFLAAHFIAEHWNLDPDGFSDIYQKMTIFPGVFYLVLGLFFLKKFLDNYFRRIIPYLTVLLIFTGTNLFYYSMDDCLMSHVYSFFLFSAFLYLIKRFLDDEKRPFSLFIWISIVFGFAVLIRPTNILLLLLLAFLDVKTWGEAGKRILYFLKPRYVLTTLIIGFVIFLPQLIYWKYLTGNFMYYSYPGETFINWKNPRMLSLWFAPLNGLFIYSPLVLVFVAGIIYMIKKKIPNGIFLAVFFLLISYIFSSWHAWYFGGSFGYRPFVEYYAILALPFAFLLDALRKLKNEFIHSAGILFILFTVYYNLMFSYHPFWNVSSTWAWDDYLKHADQAKIYSWPGETYTYIDDFENGALRTLAPQREVVHSPTMAGFLNESIQYSDKISMCLRSILKKDRVSKVSASVWMNPGNNSLTGAQFFCRIDDFQNNCLYYKTLDADKFVNKPHEWARIYGTFNIPEWIDQNYYITFYIWNVKNTGNFYIDDLVLKFE